MSDNPGVSETSLGNLPEYSVAEISGAIKRTLEGSFERVRVRGEISGFKRAASGHLYLALKDAEAVLDAVCWRGTAGRLALRPEDGMEVIAVGRITSYPGRSKYQMVIESLELAGEGALLKLLEDRKRKLAAEGLFAEDRKRPLPFLPEVIGVVTSPTGAVIRDILHRLAERFPRRVLVWPVLVQGEGAAAQVAAAIQGFNALAEGGALPRPDLLIVARGGGSLDDLWAFNEEVVVRAAAESAVPLISAVGHETDTTLIDFAADRRAPTPTAAAEIAVPVRAELLAVTLDLGRRMVGAGARLLGERRERVSGLARGLPDPSRLIGERGQQLDDRAERLEVAVAGLLARRGEQAAALAARLPHPRQQVRQAASGLSESAERLTRATASLLRRRQADLGGLTLRPPTRALRDGRQALASWAARLDPAVQRLLRDAKGLAAAQARLLESVSYQATLKRGFAVVRGPDGWITRRDAARRAHHLSIRFQDGEVAVEVTGGAPGPSRAMTGKAGSTGTAGSSGEKPTGKGSGETAGKIGPAKQGRLF